VEKARRLLETSMGWERDGWGERSGAATAGDPRRVDEAANPRKGSKGWRAGDRARGSPVCGCSIGARAKQARRNEPSRRGGSPARSRRSPERRRARHDGRESSRDAATPRRDGESRAVAPPERGRGSAEQPTRAARGRAARALEPRSAPAPTAAPGPSSLPTSRNASRLAPRAPLGFRGRTRYTPAVAGRIAPPPVPSLGGVSSCVARGAILQRSANLGAHAGRHAIAPIVRSAR